MKDNETKKLIVKLAQKVSDRWFDGEEIRSRYGSEVNTAINKKYLPWLDASPLKSALSKAVGLTPKLWISLNVKCKEGSNEVKQLDMNISFNGNEALWDISKTEARYDMAKIDQVTSDYMRSIGYPLGSDNPDNVLRFVRKLHEEIPVSREYLVIEEE